MEANRLSPDQSLALLGMGNALSLGQCLEGNRTLLFARARQQLGRQLRGKVDAEDLVQETFLEAHRQWRSFRGTTEAELYNWLDRILAGRIADTMRRYLGCQARDVRLEVNLALEMSQSSEDPDPGLVARQDPPNKQAAQREELVLLVRTLNLLPEDYRAVLLLRHQEDLTFPEIAQRIQRSLDSVKKLHERAIDRLRRSLTDWP
jgi:RNA polymerase sigma-70 factor (ECF subfamily)